MTYVLHGVAYSYLCPSCDYYGVLAFRPRRSGRPAQLMVCPWTWCGAQWAVRP